MSVAATHINSIVPREAGHFALPPAYHFGILYAFFGLSGFLVTASAERLGLGNFMLNRSLRIFPALMVDIALGRGARRGLHHAAPGGLLRPPDDAPLSAQHARRGAAPPARVFEASTVSAVNYSLWTVPFELAGQRADWRTDPHPGFRLAPALALLWVAAGFAVAALHGRLGPLETGLRHLFVLKGSRLLVAFLLGIAATAGAAASRAAVASSRRRSRPASRSTSGSPPARTTSPSL